VNKGADQPKGPDSQEQELPKIGKEKLAKILAQHKRWVESEGKEGARAVLGEGNLQEADLRGANLQEADLRGANLQKADLRGANLQEADLSEANLQEADLSEANLQKAVLYEANLQKTVLYKANLQKADLSEANLQKADLYKANLHEADLSQANLQGAGLKGANLQGADLTRAALRRADLSNANLQDADLSEANLQEAVLYKANLQKAVLEGANLRDATLQNASLRDVAGLLTGQLAGANVNNAELPSTIGDFRLSLEHLEELSKNARKLYFAVLLGCAYGLLTIVSTNDLNLLTNAPSLLLPNVSTAVPTVGVYFGAPSLLLGLYVYFHLYMQHLWTDLAALPAVFPDGRPLDRVVYPWLPNGLVRSHFRLLRTVRPPLSQTQTAIPALLVWWPIPLTLMLFWLRYLARHDWDGTLLHIFLVVAGLRSAQFFQTLARKTLRGEWEPSRARGRAQRVRLYLHRIIVPVGISAIFYLCSFLAIHGFGIVEPVRANLQEADISSKPPNWTGNEEEIPLVKGAHLEERDLRNANAYRAFLVNADLRRANLQRADLREADLRRANLQQADLSGADLSGADLEGANLQEATGLRASQIKAANGWDKAYYNDDFVTRLGLPADHNQMQCSRLSLLPTWCHDLLDQR
jgi:uncharacterized protein YjbI with pentapeptide repeats